MLPCAILCGGLATRLRPLTETIPKSLIEVKGEPFLFHQLRLLQRHGVRDVLLCVGYLGEMIEERAGDGSAFGVRLTYSYDGPALKGTAGALVNALSLLPDSFFVLYGDSYLPCEYRLVAEAFAASEKPALMTIYRNEGLFDTSNVEARNGVIVSYDKQNRSPAMQYIDYGLGVFRKSVFEQLPFEGQHDLALVYQRILAEGNLAGYEVAQRFYEIGSLSGIRDLESFLTDHPPQGTRTTMTNV